MPVSDNASDSDPREDGDDGRGLHSSTFRLNLRAFCEGGGM